MLQVVEITIVRLVVVGELTLTGVDQCEFAIFEGASRLW